MPSKLPDIILNDDFAQGCLRSVSSAWPVLDGRAPGLRAARERSQEAILECMTVFLNHYGVEKSSDLPDFAREELTLLRLTLVILANCLGLHPFVEDFKTLIEADWIAHVDLGKKPRYRDHITHPARVTAVGWWLLFRNKAKLLVRSARFYRRNTRGYCKKARIDIDEWWANHPRMDRFLPELQQHVFKHTPTYQGGRLADDDLTPWMAIAAYAWLASGLLHDLGYALEIQLRAGTRLFPSYGCTLPELGPAIGRVLPAGCAPDICHRLAGSLFAGRTPDLAKRLNALAKSEESSGATSAKIGSISHAHALLGALHLINRRQGAAHDVKMFVLQLAARAVVSHHDKSLGHICTDELSRLLYISDNLQAWGRPVLHRHPCDDKGERKITNIVECKEIELYRRKDYFLGRFQMNSDENVWPILKRQPYEWSYTHFQNPNRKLTSLLKREALYPRIILSRQECIRPRAFFDFMKP